MRFRDSLSFIYVEHAVVEQEGSAIALFTAEGRCDVPAAALGCLMLGPGTRITHAAVKALADCGCVINWIGEDGFRMYAGGIGKTRSSRNIEVQARAWADPVQHELVVRRLYELRFRERLPTSLSLQQIRGREGARVRDLYAHWSRTTNVSWEGRRYERGSWRKADPMNRALSAANAALYGICHAGLHACGYSSALGFLHTGKQLSFVYDLADIYKGETSIPAAFQAVAAGEPQIEQASRRHFRERVNEVRLMELIVRDLNSLFGGDGEGNQAVDESVTQLLWDPGTVIFAGNNYAPDDLRELP